MKITNTPSRLLQASICVCAAGIVAHAAQAAPMAAPAVHSQAPAPTAPAPAPTAPAKIVAPSQGKGVETAPALKDFKGKNCWVDSAKQYQIDPYLLFAVAMVESGLNPLASNGNTNMTMDQGLMQINDWWLPKLAKYGIGKEELKKPCVSVQVGAWILAQSRKQLGNNWQSIGAYNAVSPDLRLIYARKVYLMYDRLNLWGKTYQAAYVKRYGVQPAYTPKPPTNWLNFK